MKASVSSIETLGLVDGPGIRVVVFFNGCKLRCKYCHNPETWQIKENNYTVDDLFDKLIRFKTYFKNNGGVTFSGGEPLLHSKFLIDLCKKLRKENIHIALDTSGVGDADYEELLEYIDLVILDIKAVDKESYKEITGYEIEDFMIFLEVCQKLNKKLWLRQVIVPGINDKDEDVIRLSEYAKTLKNIEKIELLPYHLLGIEKYKKIGVPYLLDGTPALTEDRIKELSELLK